MMIKKLGFIFLLVASSTLARSQTVIADLVKDFEEGHPAHGWNYLWNQNGTIGDALHYVDLKASSFASEYGPCYAVDSGPEMPNTTKDAGYLSIRRQKNIIIGDCGNGVQQGAREEKYTIISYKISDAGTYLIANGYLKSAIDTKKGNGFDYKIFVNDNIKKEGVVKPTETVNIDSSLGALSPGDVIYIAIGPGKAADWATFVVQYQIALAK